MIDPIVKRIYDSVEHLNPAQRHQLLSLITRDFTFTRSADDVQADISSMKMYFASAEALSPKPGGQPTLSGRYAAVGNSTESEDTVAIVREVRSQWEDEFDDLLAPAQSPDDSR